MALAILGALAMVRPALAAAEPPPTPVLIGTTPSSPNTDLQPYVRGNSTGVIITVFPGLRTAGPLSAAEPGARTIVLYPQVGCEGTPLAEGTAVELDSTGIRISVAPESTVFVSARQVDEEGESGCSNAVQYRHVKELPKEEPPSGEEPPTGGGGGPSVDPTRPPGTPRIRTVPGPRANYNIPLVTGTAPNAANVRLYADPACKGQPIARGSAAQLAAGFQVTVVDDDAAVFSALGVNSAGTSACSDPVVYVEDSTLPKTRITMAPAGKTRKRVAVIRFRDVNGDATGTSFYCKVDKRKWRRCSSPLRLKKLKPKRYKVRIRAIDAAGNAERRGVKRSFRVVPRA